MTNRTASFLIISLLFCFSCSSQSTEGCLVIEGSIDTAYDGRYVYFCPQPHPTADIVDSTLVKAGKFRFVIPADSVYIADLVLANSAKSGYERLLVAVEPGTLDVHLDKQSFSMGTPLNNELQEWKNFMVAQYSAAESPSATLEPISDYVYEAILRNPNPLGGFLYHLFEGSFDQPRRSFLDSLGFSKLKPDVSKRPHKK